MKHERRSIKQKLESAFHFWYEAHDAVEDLARIHEQVKAGRDPYWIEVPFSVYCVPGTYTLGNPETKHGYKASYWDAVALKVKHARKCLGLVQSACRQMAREQLKREGKR